MRNVVVVPCAEEDTWGCGSPAHHERCKVGDAELVCDVDGNVYEETDEGEEEAEGDEGTASTGVVGGEGED